MLTVAGLVADYLQYLALAGRSGRTIGNYRQYLANFTGFADRNGAPASGSANNITRDLIAAY